MELTIIADNLSACPELVTQHGLSFWIKRGRRGLIFDTGSDASWLDNARRLGINPLEAEWLVLSHGHWDHGGGVPALLEAGWQGTLLVHPEAWQPRRAVAAGQANRDVGLPWGMRELVAHNIRVEQADTPRELFPGAWLTGPIDGEHLPPTAPGLQKKVGEAWRVDDFVDEQTLVISTALGLVVVTGCCHRGVLNTLTAARAVSGCEEIYALVGGLHLKDEPKERCLELAREIRAAGVEKVWANHCTGLYPFAQMKEVLGDDLVWAEAGMTLSI